MNVAQHQINEQLNQSVNLHKTRHSHFCKSILTFQLDSIFIKLPPELSFVVYLFIDDSKLMFSPKATDIKNKFSIDFKTQKIIQSRYNSSNTRAKARRIRISITIFDKNKKIISTGKTIINPGMFLDEEKLKLRPLSIDISTFNPCPIFFFALTLKNAEISNKSDPKASSNENNVNSNTDVIKDENVENNVEIFKLPDTFIISKPRIRHASSDDEFCKPTHPVERNPVLEFDNSSDNKTYENLEIDNNKEKGNENNIVDEDEIELFKINNPDTFKINKKPKRILKQPKQRTPEEKRKKERLNQLMKKHLPKKKIPINKLKDNFRHHSKQYKQIISKLSPVNIRRSYSCEPKQVREPKLYFPLRISFCFSFSYSLEPSLNILKNNQSNSIKSNTTDDLFSKKNYMNSKALMNAIFDKMKDPELHNLAHEFLNNNRSIYMNNGKIFLKQNKAQNRQIYNPNNNHLIIDEVCTKGDIDSDKSGNIRTRIQSLEMEAKLRWHHIRMRRYNTENRPKLLLINNKIDYEWTNSDYSSSSDEEYLTDYSD